jgi:hypothetical protein
MIVSTLNRRSRWCLKAASRCWAVCEVSDRTVQATLPGLLRHIGVFIVIVWMGCQVGLLTALGHVCPVVCLDGGSSCMLHPAAACVPCSHIPARLLLLLLLKSRLTLSLCRAVTCTLTVHLGVCVCAFVKERQGLSTRVGSCDAAVSGKAFLSEGSGWRGSPPFTHNIVFKIAVTAAVDLTEVTV